jgi:SAM-dependent MidA family methyltransferase
VTVPPDNPAGLPLPAPAEGDGEARAKALVEQVRAEIAASADGAIDFARYMALALYAPGLGYYMADDSAIGPRGDFVTAPELSPPLFAACLAHQCAEIIHALGGGAALLEAGAGSGRLAAELLKVLAQLDALPDRYEILEISPAWRARQAATQQREVPWFLDRVRWLEAPPAKGFRGIVLANELLDALPVVRFRTGPGGTVRQLAVGWEDGGFVWRERDPMGEVAARVCALDLPEGYTSEIGLEAEAWVRRLGAALEAGVMLLIDYGFPRAEFYHPDRIDGTIMCHYRHHAHGDPLILTGLQDITAHVDFSAIAAAGREAGLELLGYTSQGAFLLGCGLEALAAEPLAEARAQLERAQAIKKLTLPHEMGELFKVIALGRGVSVEPTLCGFRWQDRRSRL